MEIVEMNSQIVVKNLLDFDPKHIFECGQCFRWDKELDGSYTGVAFGKVLNVKKEEDSVIFKHGSKEDFHRLWTPYFDLDKDYGKIKAELIKDDEIMKSATELGQGIRILQQDPWETLISFIISSNNNIPRIKKAVNLISERFGLYLGEYDGKKYYSFPEPEVLSSVSIEELTACGVGYRAKYILETAKAVVEKNMVLHELKKLDSEKCFEALLQFHGVGPKVANCILFFAMGKVEAFPVDVWVKRVMEYFYFKKDTPNKEIERFGKEKFGKYAGYGQQYLFYYAREEGIGK